MGRILSSDKEYRKQYALTECFLLEKLKYVHTVKYDVSLSEAAIT